MTKQQPRTLADMPIEELIGCIGMWCEYRPGAKEDGEPVLGIFAYWQWVREEAIMALPEHPNVGNWSTPENVTPRFDLPRAWNPDGTPVDADPEEYTVEASGFVQLADGGGAQRTSFPPGAKVRRWVSDWEEIE